VARLIRHDRRRATRRLVRAAVLGVVCICLARVAISPARAQSESSGLPSDSGDAAECPSTALGTDRAPKQLTLLGVSCFRNGQYARAYSFYSRAYELQRSDLLRAAMGRSLHELGLYGPARAYYRSFLDGRSTDESTRKIERRLEQLSRDIESDGVTARLTSFPTGAEVHLEVPNGDWVEIGRTPAEVSLASGTYRFKFDRPGARRTTRTATLEDPSTPVEVDAELYPVDSEFDVQGRKLKRAGIYTMLASIPVLTTGGILFGLSADKFAEAEDFTFDADFVPAEQNRILETAHDFRQWGIGVTAVGTGALITGAVLFFRGRALEVEASSGESSTRVQPVLSPRTVGIRGRF